MKKKKFFICFVSIFLALSLGTGVTIAALSNDGGSLGEQYAEAGKTTGSGGNETGDYMFTRPDIIGNKIEVIDPKLRTANSWVTYLDYIYLREETDPKTGDVYRFYDPTDYNFATVMKTQSFKPDQFYNPNDPNYNPDDPNGEKNLLWCDYLDLAPIFVGIVAGNLGVVLSGGIASGIYGGISQTIFAGMSAGALQSNSYYYADEYFTGLSNAYYSMDSMSVTAEYNRGWQIEKTKSTEYTYTTGGETAVESNFLLASTKFVSKIESALNYGVSFNESQNSSQGVSKTVTFNARNDEEVRNVPWRLVEYTVKIPLKVEHYKKVDNQLILEEEFYMSYNLLHGIVREFANGYIEHWNTGKLVYRADFFEGFYTEKQLIDTLKDREKSEIDDLKIW